MLNFNLSILATKHSENNNRLSLKRDSKCFSSLCRVLLLVTLSFEFFVFSLQFLTFSTSTRSFSFWWTFNFLSYDYCFLSRRRLKGQQHCCFAGLTKKNVVLLFSKQHTGSVRVEILLHWKSNHTDCDPNFERNFSLCHSTFFWFLSSFFF